MPHKPRYFLTGALRVSVSCHDCVYRLASSSLFNLCGYEFGIAYGSHLDTENNGLSTV